MRTATERGQSTVEFALIVPLVIVTTLALVQVAVVAYAQVTVTHLAREIGRASAVDPAVDIGRLAPQIATLRSDRLSVAREFHPGHATGSQWVEITVSYEVPPVAAIFAGVVGDLAVSATATFAVES